MKISELILAVGDDNIRFQSLNNDAHRIEDTKNGTKITFYTDGVTAYEAMTSPGKTKNIGLVLWLPRDLVDAALLAASPSPPADGTVEEGGDA